MTAEVIEHPPLLVRLTQDVGSLTSGLSCFLPSDMAVALIRRRLATPIGDMNAFADVVITHDELPDVGITWEAIQAS